MIPGGRLGREKRGTKWSEEGNEEHKRLRFRLNKVDKEPKCSKEREKNGM
jgi:hypothetical protein